jgi:hypothetical protein
MGDDIFSKSLLNLRREIGEKESFKALIFAKIRRSNLFFYPHLYGGAADSKLGPSESSLRRGSVIELSLVRECVAITVEEAETVHVANKIPILLQRGD